MDFLPITSNGKKVYAGFWKRFSAGVVDCFILLPLSFLFVWLEGLDRNFALAIVIPVSSLFVVYNVLFNLRYGGTPGKLAVGIRITRPDGTPITWSEAWKRSSVDCGFALLWLVVQVWALAHVDPEEYSSLNWVDRAQLLRRAAPSWFSSFDSLQQVWMWSEVVILLFNKRKRAIHDFIAGTVVVHKQFAGSRVRENAANVTPTAT
jgi:uncharacterized RDD family membrane protein YckC